MVDASADPPARGSCAGFSIRSRIPFRSLRSGPGEPLTVAEESVAAEPRGALIRRWDPRPGNAFEGRLLADDARYAFWASDGGWYRIDPAIPSITLDTGVDSLRRELRMFGIPAALCTVARGDISIHASAIEVDGHGILLAAPGMHGKTTLAAAFARAGHRLLSEDTTRCTVEPAAAIYPGPAAIRLREDVAASFADAGTRVTSLDEGRVPLLIDPDRRGDGAPVPLRAIIVLRGESDSVRLEPVTPQSAARDLFALSFTLPDRASTAEGFSRVVDLASRVEVLHLQRPIRLDGLDAVVDHVLRHVGGAG